MVKRQFTVEEIEGSKNFFLSNDYSLVDCEVGGRSFQYFVLSNSLTTLKNFAFRATGNCLEYVLGVSEDVPSEFRSYWMLHEYAEYVEGKRCIEALEEELNLVPEGIRNDYLSLRRRFFIDLVEYCKESGQYDNDVIAEFVESRNRLEELCSC
jgi:hypothetical protein